MNEAFNLRLYTVDETVPHSVEDAARSRALASKERAWIVRCLGWSCLCFWPGEIGEGDPITFEFANVTEARRFYFLNVAHDRACAECFQAERVHGSRHCRECKEMLSRLSSLQARYKAMRAAVERRSETWKRLALLQDQFAKGDATDADKAAVLDQIMADAKFADDDEAPPV